MHMPSRFAALLLAATLQAVAVARDSEHNPVVRESRAAADAPALGVIMKLRPSLADPASQKLSTNIDRNHLVARRTGLAVSLKREIAAATMAVDVDLAGLPADEVLRRLRADPEVEYAVIDHRRFPHATNPNDSLFSGQWYLQATEVSAVNAIGAWDRELGSPGVVIAVLDTGVLYDHPDLGRADKGGKLLPGFDFVTGILQANDGDGHDADPSDPGDWINGSDITNSVFKDCALSDSTWHGTRVAGMIGALTNNSAGVAGLDWNSFILPVRVLGKCGGTDSDIIAGMRWAAGLHVAGVPDNPTPARILNLSLGGSGACEASYLDAIQELTARKVLVVISAGNESTVVSSPGNCPGVAAVAAIRHAGNKVGFSSLGPQVTIAAPGGNCVNLSGPCLFSLDTTSNAGTTTPGAHIFTDQLNSNLGTSFSAPIVSGIAALMLSQNNNLSTSQMLARLREGARPFPISVVDAPDQLACHVPVDDQDVQQQCLCTPQTCGAGMADAANSVAAAERPIAAVTLPANIAPGQNVTLNGAASAAACGRSVTGFSWTVVAPTTNPPTIVGADTSRASVIAPTTGSITLRLTVTDDQDHSDSADVQIDPTRASSAAPASAGATPCATPVTSGPTPGNSPPSSTTPPASPPRKKGGGGGGSLELVSLTLLGLLAWARRIRRSRACVSRCI